MTEKAVKKEQKEAPVAERTLLEPEDWQEPQGRKVIGEFHKEGLPADQKGVDADLERFEEYWLKKGCVNIQGEYHKEGAPYMDEADEKEAKRTLAEMKAARAKEAETPQQEAPKQEKPKEVPPAAKEAVKEAPKPADGEIPPEPQSDRKINTATIEIITYALFRAIFGQGVRIPLKKEGIVDADITIHDKDIIINTNEFYAAIPELSVWRVTYTHRGKPIFQFGRGVPKGMKVYRWNALILGIGLWRQTRAATKAKEKAKKAAERAREEGKA